eukprot:COSAG01_NODE_9347_length_2476_cov_1.586454_1_plen_104_part_10
MAAARRGGAARQFDTGRRSVCRACSERSRTVRASTMVPALVSLLLAVSTSAPTVVVAGAAAPAATCAGFELHNSSGCTSAGHYQGTKAAGPDACCALCTNQTQC